MPTGTREPAMMLTLSSSCQNTFSVKFTNLLEGLPFRQSGHDHLVATGLGQLLPHVPHVGDVLDVVHLITVGNPGSGVSSPPSGRCGGFRCGHTGTPLARTCTC